MVDWKEKEKEVRKGEVAHRQRGCLRVDVQHGGQGERNCFAGTRLGYSYDVAAAQSHGPCLALNGRRL